MGFDDIADGSSPNVLAEPPITLVTMALVAHHRGELASVGRLNQSPGLPQVMAKGFLTKHVLAELDRPRRSRSMVMVGSRHENRIDLPRHRVEHPSVITKAPRLGPGFRGFLGSRTQTAIIHINNCHQSLPESGRQACLAAAAAADHGGGQFGIG